MCKAHPLGLKVPAEAKRLPMCFLYRESTLSNFKADTFWDFSLKHTDRLALSEHCAENFIFP